MSAVAAIVLSHNYGALLSKALESILAQTVRPGEILVVDDASSDDTPEVAASFAERGVRYLRVDDQHVHRARCAGVDSTHSPLIMFLDADDWLAPDYLEQGVGGFSEDSIAVVYSDVEYHGELRGRSKRPREFDHGAFQRENYVHAGSIVRRSALLDSRAFDESFDQSRTHGDWFLWRRVLKAPWTAVWQPSTYYYRRHSDSMGAGIKTGARPATYFERAGLSHETVTLFLPLSGRTEHWSDLAEFLELQDWPRQQIRLILFDTSQDSEFSETIRQWVATSDYRDVRYISAEVGRKGLADEDRRDAAVKDAVRRAVKHIYSAMIRHVETEYVWVIEDDILPPLDTCNRLLEGFDTKVASVSAAYRSRYHGDFVAWNRDEQCLSTAGTGLQPIAGHGFGCTILRKSVFGQIPVFGDGSDDFDFHLFRQLHDTPFESRIQWATHCRHLQTESGTSQPSQTGCVCSGPGFCDRHQCAKTPHWHHLCQTRADYFGLWESGNGPGQSRPQEPGIARKAVNFGKAVAQHVADGRRTVSDAVYETRLSVCRECSSCDTNRMVCREPGCGCRIKIKARWHSQNCPLEKWPALVNDSSS